MAETNRRPCGIVAVALLVSLAACGAGESHEDELRSRLQARLDSIHVEHGFPGATLGVVLADGTSFGLAVGLADSAGVAMRPDHRQLSGSIGKTFAAAVALDLVSEHIFGLNDPVEKWLGSNDWYERLPNASDITVRMLMNHTAGIPDNVADSEFLSDIFLTPDRVWEPWEMVSYIFDEEPLFPAGTDFRYTDTDYILLGMVIEAATGTPFYQELQERVVDRFSLDVVPSDNRRIERLANGYPGSSIEAALRGYGTDWSGTPSTEAGAATTVLVDGVFVINPQFEWTGGGLAVTAESLARWAKLLYEGRYLSESMVATMLGGTSGLGERVYGLGVSIWPDTPLGLAYGHGGFMTGFRSQMMYFAEHKIAVAMQANTNVGPALGPPMTELVLELAGVIVGGAATKR